jgi:hypothetical protein
MESRRLASDRKRARRPAIPGRSDVQIARRSDLHFGNAFDEADLGANGFGDLQWGRAQRLGERENRNREVP